MALANDLTRIAPRPARRRTVNWPLAVGGTIVGLVLVMALAAPLLAPYSPYDQSLVSRLLPPAWVEGGNPAHLLGTDHLGRDYLSRLIYGARVSLSIGLVTILISGSIGVTLGVLAGYFGGRVDTLVTYLVTVRLAMPAVIVALAIVALVGNSFQTIMTVLGLLLWDQFAIVSRSVTRQIVSQDYIMAARSMGMPTAKIIVSDLLPNLMPMVVVVATVEMASAIMVESSLSFLGLGVQPPTLPGG
ncbi:ABC transporter permease [Methylobrevis pamukkalensis]|uniref:Dipeptide transport system permease protein DppC n=1 Tax=Methylobrevis pamukkalensis TaxID=1439726 RepID=A0A1E3H619_9HYPH|nr:ABC transporter permease [Methylobrevis pamukkalensis]ODN71767.1 Dipeptide transport system permease protein DppC [Methylobrevis pamukkalensis]